MRSGRHSHLAGGNQRNYPKAYSGYTKLTLRPGYVWNGNNTPIRTTPHARNLADKKLETAVGVQDVGRVISFEMLAKFSKEQRT